MPPYGLRDFAKYDMFLDQHLVLSLSLLLNTTHNLPVKSEWEL